MNLDMFLGNVLSPPILFFLLGVFAALVKSDLSIPQPIPKLLSVILLMDIGFHGGHELWKSGASLEMLGTLVACVIMASVVPVYSFLILRTRLSMPDAVAMAACFGSISAVTFVTGVNFLRSIEVPFDGYIVAGMALMESPAILAGILIYHLVRDREAGGDHPGIEWGRIVSEAVFSGSVLLLIGALLIGAVTGEAGWHSFGPFYQIFKGILLIYLLEAGMNVTDKLKSLTESAGAFVFGFCVAMPLFNATIGIVLAKFVLGMPEGTALLFTLLCASASYIAVPVGMRISIPDANPAYMIPVALGMVFPFNVIVGIPLYYFVISHLW